MLTLERLKEVMDCDPEKGIFTWKMRIGRSVIGTPAGTVRRIPPGYPYVTIGVDKKFYPRHRLVWFFVHGEWPLGHIDHKNGVPGDDRIENLRCVTRSQNIANSRLRKDNESGFKGAYYHKPTGRWRSVITLGQFDTAEEAHAAYKRVALQLHGEFARFK